MRVPSKTLLSIGSLIASVFCASVVLGCSGSGATDEETTTYLEEIKVWRQKRIERLKSPTGWLTLVGLHWLEEGKNTVGADPTNDIVFPEGRAPAFVGAISLSDGVITIEVEPDVGVVHREQSVTSLTMRHDQDSEHEATILQLGSLSWYAVERGGRLGIRVKDSESERRREFKGIETYRVDRRWRIEGHLEPHDTLKMISIPNVLGTESKEPSPGTLVFEIDGKTCRLDPIAEPGDEKLFVVFGDTTNGRETYGGGRFLYVDAPGADGKVVIDFNKAYNPPCAFTPYATCPLPPRQNLMPIAIRAGEKAYGTAKH